MRRSAARALLLLGLTAAIAVGCVLPPPGGAPDAGAADGGRPDDAGPADGGGADGGDAGAGEPPQEACLLAGAACSEDAACCGDLRCGTDGRCEDPRCPGDDDIAGRAAAPAELLALPPDAVLTACPGARFLDVFRVEVEAGEELQVTLETEGLPPDVEVAQGEPDLDVYLLRGPPTGVTEGALGGDLVASGYSFWSTERVRHLADEPGVFYVAVTPYNAVPGRYRLIARKGRPCEGDVDCAPPEGTCRVYADTPSYLWGGQCAAYTAPACGDGPDEGGLPAASDSGAIPYTSPVSGALCAGDVDVYAFDVVAPDAVQIRLRLEDETAGGEVRAVLWDGFGDVFPLARVFADAAEDATAFQPWPGAHRVYLEYAAPGGEPGRDVPYALEIEPKPACTSDADCAAPARCRFTADALYGDQPLFFCDEVSPSCGAGPDEPASGGDGSADAVPLPAPLASASGLLCASDVDAYAVDAAPGDQVLVSLEAPALPAGYRVLWAFPPDGRPAPLDRGTPKASVTFPVGDAPPLLYLALLAPDGAASVDVPYALEVEVARGCTADADCAAAGEHCHYEVQDDGAVLSRCAPSSPAACGAGPEDSPPSYSAGTARPVTAPVSGLTCGGDVDVFSLEADAGDSLVLDVSAALSRPDERLAVVLVAPDGAPLGAAEVDDFSDRASVVAEAPSSGTFFAFLEYHPPAGLSSADVAYELELEALRGCNDDDDCEGAEECLVPFLGVGASAAPARVCLLWPAPSCGVGPEDTPTDAHSEETARDYAGPVDSALCAADLDVFAFDAQPGDLFDIRVTQPQGSGAWGVGVGLTSPNGTLVAWSAGPHPAGSPGLEVGPLAAEGTYLVHLASFPRTSGAIVEEQSYRLDVREVIPCRDDGDCPAGETCALPDVTTLDRVCSAPLGDVCGTGDANGGPASAQEVTPGAPLNATSCGADLDYFVLPHQGPADLVATLAFDGNAADLDLVLYAPDGTLYAAAQTVASPEVVTLPSVPDGDYLAVVGTFACYGGACDAIPYSLTVDAVPSECNDDEECVATASGFEQAPLLCDNDACRRPFAASLQGRGEGQLCYDDYDCRSLDCATGVCGELAP